MKIELTKLDCNLFRQRIIGKINNYLNNLSDGAIEEIVNGGRLSIDYKVNLKIE